MTDNSTEQDANLEVPTYRAFPTDKTIPWHVRRWNGSKWVPVAGTSRYYEEGAKQEAERLNLRTKRGE